MGSSRFPLTYPDLTDPLLPPFPTKNMFWDEGYFVSLSHDWYFSKTVFSFEINLLENHFKNYFEILWCFCMQYAYHKTKNKSKS